jgi:hypothetical protein
LIGRVEKRCILRHALGLYGNLTAAALYTREQSGLEDRIAFISAIKHCIASHPILSASIKDPDSERPVFVRPHLLYLDNHFQFLDPVRLESEDDVKTKSLEDFMARMNDMPCAYQDGIPAWKLVVLPLVINAEVAATRFWVGFSYSHSHGDGKSALAFHHALLRGLQDARSTTSNAIDAPTIETKDVPPLPPSFEAVADLKISWSYLLSPVLSVYLPQSVSASLGLKSGLNFDPDAWIGKPCLHDAAGYQTGVDILSISNQVISATLDYGRSKGAKFSGILHQAIVYGLSKQLTAGNKKPKFSSLTSLNLRDLVPAYGDNDMINCFSGAFGVQESFTIDDSLSIPEFVWKSAENTTKHLASRVSTLENQPIGLLRYLRNFRQYFVNQIGKERDSSYEISNIGIFDPSATKGSWTVQKMLFAQPSNVVGPTVNVNIACVRGSDLVITITWQRGVLGVPDEDKFIHGVILGIDDFFKRASQIES